MRPPTAPLTGGPADNGPAVCTPGRAVLGRGRGRPPPVRATARRPGRPRAAPVCGRRRGGASKASGYLWGRRRTGTNRVLIDEGKERIESENQEALQRDYTGTLCVGKDGAPESGSSDKAIGEFCARERCDLLTGDKRAYTELLEVEGVKEVQISKYVWDEKSGQQIYRIRMR